MFFRVVRSFTHPKRPARRKSSYTRSYYRRRRDRGLSLTELLVGTVIAAAVITALLTLMVNLLNDNQREQARSGVEQDMRRALEFISNDLREAAYVYTGDQLNAIRRDADATNGVTEVGPLLNYITAFPAGVTPILAFWKLETLPYDNVTPPSVPTVAQCNTLFPTPASNIPTAQNLECRAVNVERRTYSLVVYAQNTNANTNFQGVSRIERYQYRKYSNVANITRSTGYVDPVNASNFELWPFRDNENLQGASLLVGTSDVLVDFVAAPAVLPANVQRLTCPTTGAPDYIPSPRDANGTTGVYASDNAFNFFACVRSPRAADIRFNQDVIVFLRGNARGRTGIESDTYIEAIQTRAIIRGIVDKTVSD